MIKLDKIIVAAVVFLSLAAGITTLSAESGKPLILQDMSWVDVKEYLETDDMVIIPLGSTEQHGPHLPLGTDFYEALEISKKISSRTGVLVAPVVMAGYSYYHSGFPGSLSLKPETLEQVLFETAEMLIKYGFRKFMFLNYHGGNSIAESNVIHRINHTTEAAAVKIGIGASFEKPEELPAPFDFHAGIGETSNMLYLKPELVKMERAKKPEMTLSPQIKEIQRLMEKHPELASATSAYLAVPAETKKGGASHELSNNGIWTYGDPQNATNERGKKNIQLMVDGAAAFIEAWKKIPAAPQGAK